MQNSQRKRVLYVITKSAWGGAQRYVFDLATNLSSEHFETAAAIGPHQNKQSGSLETKLKEKNIPVYIIRSFQKSINPIKDIYALFELLSIYKKFRPDIIHTNSSKAGGIASVAAYIYSITINRRVYRVFTVHGWAFLESWRPLWQVVLIRIASKITVFLHHTIIVISKRDETAAHRYNVARPAKVTRIYNGIAPIQFLSRKEAQQNLFRKEYPLVIGTIAEWTKNKGIIYLIKAMFRVHKKCPGAVLGIVGWGEEKPILEKTIKKYNLENTIFLISKSPAAPSLKAFDVFVLPSLKEGLPYTLLEAGYAALPVIATPVGGISEIIENEQNGLLVEPASSDQLASAIVYLLQNKELREHLGKKNNERVRKVCTLEKMIAETTAMYNKW